MCSFHEDDHSEGSCSDKKSVVGSVCNRALDVASSAQGQPRDTDDDEDVASDEASSFGDVLNMYQCLQTTQKTNTDKQPQKKNDRYTLRNKGAPLTLGEAKQKLELLRKVDPPAVQKQKTQSKPKKITTDKSTSMSSKLQNTPSNNTNTSLTPDISVSLPP